MLVLENSGAAPQVRGRRPRRPAGTLINSSPGGPRGPRADQGVRPTIVLKKRRIKRPRKNVFQPKRLRLASKIHQRHLNITTKFPQNLPARPAGRSKLIRSEERR